MAVFYLTYVCRLPWALLLYQDEAEIKNIENNIEFEAEKLI